MLRLALALCLLSCRQTEGTWEPAPPLLHARAAHAVVATDNAILVFAGTGAGGAPVLPVERFDGAAWTVVSQLPGPGLNAPAAAVLADRVYLIGGFNLATNVPSDRVHIYTPATAAWSDAAPLPSPRGGHAAVVLDGKIHVLGGGNDRSTLADHSVYDPLSNKWSERAPLPRPEGSPAVVNFKGHIYAIGGRSGSDDYGSVDIYDPAADAWTAGPPITPRGTAGALVHCGEIHLFGGESQARRESLSEVLRLDASAGWQPLPAMPTARNFARAVALHGAVYVVGGSPTPEPGHDAAGSAIVERYLAACP